MNRRDFQTVVPGKWVLAGEHTVLRGGSAIALPHPEFRLSLSFRSGASGLLVSPDLASLPVQDLLRVAREWLGNRETTLDWPKGELKLESTIPFGAGLGSSAALSVAVARWILDGHPQSEAENQDLELELARTMEDRFHGKSSGMDVAVVSRGEPILFSIRDGAQALNLARLPEFTFHDTGLRASTKESIERVERLRVADPKRALELDAEMALSTQDSLAALRRFAAGDSDSLRDLARAMKSGQSVFQDWGLVPPEAEAIVKRAEAAGARAARVTGAGGGGFVVALL